MSTWSIQPFGGPPAGTIAAVTLGQQAGGGTAVFVGSEVGIFRAAPYQGGGAPAWERLPNAPGGVMALAAAPTFAADPTLLAGTHTGVWRSTDGGETWSPARMPLSNATVLCLAFSPDYANDGVVLAGSLQDGIFYSNDRGASWTTRNFGVLDSAALALAFSPHFDRDGVVFAATDTAIYHSYNQARAWKAIYLPEDAAPVLSLAVSPNFARDHTLFAGTESAGLYRSRDRGLTWQRLGLQAASISALAFAPRAGGWVLLAATENGVFASTDGGASWSDELIVDGVLCLAVGDGVVLAGTADDGLWACHRAWERLAGPPSRALVGLTLPAGFERRRVAFLHGPNEGIWQTRDGGTAWEDLSENLPTLAVFDLAAHPHFDHAPHLAAATDAGVLTSADGGAGWQVAAPDEARLVCYSPNGKILAASFTDGSVRYSEDEGRAWQTLPGPWDAGGSTLALAVSNLRHWIVAHLEASGEQITLWQGRPAQWEKVLSHPATPNPVAAVWVPTEPAAGRPWYVGIGQTVYRCSGRTGSPPVSSPLLTGDHPGERILSLVGLSGEGEPALLACTGQYLYYSADGGTAWALAHDFGRERALKLAPADGSPRAVYALMLGGTLVKLTMKK